MFICLILNQTCTDDRTRSDGVSIDSSWVTWTAYSFEKQLHFENKFQKFMEMWVISGITRLTSFIAGSLVVNKQHTQSNQSADQVQTVHKTTLYLNLWFCFPVKGEEKIPS